MKTNKQNLWDWTARAKNDKRSHALWNISYYDYDFENCF